MASSANIYTEYYRTVRTWLVVRISIFLHFFKRYLIPSNANGKRDVHGSVHHNANLIEMTNKLQLFRTIYYSIVPWLFNMFRMILSFIIRSF